LERYLPIDEEGYFVFDGRRVDDEDLGREMLSNLRVENKTAIATSLRGQPAWVENFDAPLVARHVRLAADGIAGEIDLPYRYTARFSFASLSVDEWDRFHGVTEAGIPFVFSRGAQVEFFDLLDGFDDDSVTVRGQRYAVPPWLLPFGEAHADSFWTNIYRTEEPGWELNRESVALPDILPQLKLSKSRVLILGCGSGNDAAYFARQGHAVTAVDFSEEAIARAEQKYGSVEGLKFVRSDVFDLPADFAGRFDLVFEHTLYCAISPERRNELAGVWRRVLHSQGHLLGVFFAMEKREGPPFGGSEWELRERLKKSFEFLFWTRWRHSLEQRKGKELVVYARKRGGI
jgi:SAM-dependent methyltransferase